MFVIHCTGEHTTCGSCFCYVMFTGNICMVVLNLIFECSYIKLQLATVNAYFNACHVSLPNLKYRMANTSKFVLPCTV